MLGSWRRAAPPGEVGSAAEARALHHLQRHGLVLLARNYRIARGPGRRGGEIDLVMRDADGTVVFVEVRARGAATHGGAAASITPSKQRRIVFAATAYLSKLASPPPCRFDVVAVDGDAITWLRAAFDASCA